MAQRSRKRAKTMAANRDFGQHVFEVAGYSNLGAAGSSSLNQMCSSFSAIPSLPNDNSQPRPRHATGTFIWRPQIVGAAVQNTETGVSDIVASSNDIDP